jgi:hypothetical protein
LQPSEVVPLTSATFPAVPLMAIGVASMKSGKGSGLPTAAVLASWTRTYRPGARDDSSGKSNCCVAVAPKFPVPVALAYWRESSLSGTGVVPRLKTSM